MDLKKLPLATILILPLAAYARAGLTLEQAVDRGLKVDNVIRTEAARVSGAKAGLKQARMSRFGGLKLKGMYTDGNDPVYAFATAMKQGTFGMASLATINDPDPARNYMAGVEAGVPLFTGFAISNAEKMGKLGVEAAEAGYARANSGITFKIAYQWMMVLLRARLAGLAADSVAAAETELKTAQMLKDKGMVLGSDYYGAEAILSTLRGYKLEWDKALELEKEKLGIAVGLPGGAEVSGELRDPGYPALDRGRLEDGAAGRKDVLALRKMAQISRTAEKMQENSVLPVVEAFGSWETNSESLSDFKGNRMLGLRLTMPIGDPAWFARRDGARAEASMASSRADEADKQAAVELSEALNNYSSALETLPVTKETVEKAKQSLELFRPLYRQGRQSVLEVLRAQASVLQAEAAYYQDLFKLNLYHAQALLASETLDAAAVKDISGRLSAGNY
ncbi:MAG: TolC family protein [Elusimicrobia bacterium]|nr:TolC family protein [Elusimicrobiota bacterium]